MNFDNPFISSKNEEISDDEVFIRLFSPFVLELFKKHDLLTRISYIYSSPGGGKSTLLRVFSPTVLLNLSKKPSLNQDLYKILTQYDLIKNSKSKNFPNVLSIYYDIQELKTLEYLKITDGSKDRLFNAKLTVHIVMEVLSKIQILYQAENENISLSDMRLNVKHISKVPSRLKSLVEYDEITCSKLYKLCEEWDSEINKYLNSLMQDEYNEIPGSDFLYFDILDENNLTISGNKPFFKYRFLMLDNFQKLTNRQRDYFQNQILDNRQSYSVLIANRLEGIPPNKLFNYDVDRERPTTEIFLERAWLQNKAKYKKFVTNICELRCAQSPNKIKYGISEIKTHLGQNIDWRMFSSKISRLRDKKLDDYIAICQENRINPDAQILDLRKELADITQLYKIYEANIKLSKFIKEHNDELGLQTSLDGFFDKNESSSISIGNLMNTLSEGKQKGSLNAAKIRSKIDLQAPLFYGWDDIVNLSTFNVYHFILICRILYDEILEMKLRDKEPLSISPMRQDNLLRKKSSDIWESIVEGRSKEEYITKYFLEGICQEINRYNELPNAPNEAKRSGIGIKAVEVQNFVNRSVDEDSKFFRIDDLEHHMYFSLRFAAIKNFILPLGVKQGPRDTHKQRYFVNKLLGVKFNLDLGYSNYLASDFKILETLMNQAIKAYKTRSGNKPSLNKFNFVEDDHHD